ARQRRQLAIVQAVTRLEIAFRAGFGEAVPWADQLAIVAAEYPVADQAAQLFGDRALELDGQVGNAPSRIQELRADEGGGRANIQAGLARATVVLGMGRIHRQRQVDEQLAEKEPTASLLVQQESVLADPAQSSLVGQSLFQHWRAVDEGAVTERADLRLDALGQLLQALADQLVVIAAQGVARHIGLVRFLQALGQLRDRTGA